MNNKQIFATLEDGIIKILNEQGQVQCRMSGNDWTSVQVNGNQLFVANQRGYKYIYDENGNYVRNC